MKNKKEFKKIGVSLLVFVMMSFVINYYTDLKINALEQEKTKITKEQPQYKGDCEDDSVDFSEDIVIKIIEKMD